jgi:uncharacterized protein (DUF952 family)
MLTSPQAQESSGLIYHAALAADYTPGITYSPPAFATEGFVHLSPSVSSAVAATNRYLVSIPGEFVLLYVLVEKLPAGALKWEGGFPHCYAEIPGDAVVQVRRMRREGDGGETGEFESVET